MLSHVLGHKGDRRRRRVAAALLVTVPAGALALGLAGGAAGAAKAAPCAAWASPGGSDTNRGSRARPFRTVGRLATTLRPGQTGCLEPGTVFDEHIVLEVAGAPREPITITSGPGPRAVLAAGLELTQGARYVHIDNVVIRGRTGTSSAAATVILRGFVVRLSRSDISGGDVLDEPRTCVLLDHAGAAVVDQNAVHDCGRFNGETYAAGIRAGISVNARIVDNTIFLNPGDAVALAPNAQRTHVMRNLMVYNEAGVYFGGAAAYASRDNRVTSNVIVLSRRYAVHGSYREGYPQGSGNIAFDNCVWQTARIGGAGFFALRNRFVDPRVVRDGSGYRLLSDSPCWLFRPGAS
jgi:hypothetical protein